MAFVDAKVALDWLYVPLLVYLSSLSRRQPLHVLSRRHDTEVLLVYSRSDSLIGSDPLAFAVLVGLVLLLVLISALVLEDSTDYVLTHLPALRFRR